MTPRAPHDPPHNNVEKRYVKLQAYTMKELEYLYDKDRRTLLKWMEPFKEEIGKKIGNYYQASQIRIIFKRLPLPHNIIICDEFDDEL